MAIVVSLCINSPSISEALGKGRPLLPTSLLRPDGTNTIGNAEAADAMNSFYIDKVDKLCVRNAGKTPSDTLLWPPRKRPFTFTFVRAARIAKVIKALNATEALGTDGIPVSVLKKGVECLASPLAHLMNTSFLTGKIPDVFKDAKVHPVHKGGGKSRAEPGSYRPVSILPAMSKILEGVVKQDLEKHLAAVNGLPTSQHGFRPGRSCTTALASAHLSWTSAATSGKVVGLMGFDFSSVFDTVAKESLLPK
jgi:hypothetical protein